MIEEQVKKRDKALAIWMFLTFLIPICLIFFSRINSSLDDKFALFITWLELLCATFGFIFWIKTHYHWAKAKGRPVGWTLLAFFGFPISMIILGGVKDLKPAVLPDDPLLSCPHCGSEYRLGEYDPDVERIFCSICKKELMKT